MEIEEDEVIGEYCAHIVHNAERDLYVLEFPLRPKEDSSSLNDGMVRYRRRAHEMRIDMPAMGGPCFNGELADRLKVSFIEYASQAVPLQTQMASLSTQRTDGDEIEFVLTPITGTLRMRPTLEHINAAVLRTQVRATSGEELRVVRETARGKMESLRESEGLTELSWGEGRGRRSLVELEDDHAISEIDQEIMSALAVKIREENDATARGDSTLRGAAAAPLESTPELPCEPTARVRAWATRNTAVPIGAVMEGVRRGEAPRSTAVESEELSFVDVNRRIPVHLLGRAPLTRQAFEVLLRLQVTSVNSVRGFLRPGVPVEALVDRFQQVGVFVNGVFVLRSDLAAYIDDDERPIIGLGGAHEEAYLSKLSDAVKIRVQTILNEKWDDPFEFPDAQTARKWADTQNQIASIPELPSPPRIQPDCPLPIKSAPPLERFVPVRDYCLTLFHANEPVNVKDVAEIAGVPIPFVRNILRPIANEPQFAEQSWTLKVEPETLVQEYFPHLKTQADQYWERKRAEVAHIFSAKSS